MTTPLKSPRRQPLSRDTIARMIFDKAICDPNVSPGLALATWLEMLEGIGGYLVFTAASLEQSEQLGFGSHLAAIGETIQRSAQIASVLSQAVEENTV